MATPDDLRKVPRAQWGRRMNRVIKRVECASGKNVSMYELPDGTLLLVEHPGPEPTRARMQQALDAIHLGSTNPEGHA